MNLIFIIQDFKREVHECLGMFIVSFHNVVVLLIEHRLKLSSYSSFISQCFFSVP